MENIQALFGFLLHIPAIWLIIGIVVVTFVLSYVGAPLWLWMLYAAILIGGFHGPVWLWIVWAVVTLVLVVPPVRRMVVTGPLMKLMEALHFLPKISETEQAAIEAGTVWMEGELFSGKPDFKKINAQLYPALSDEEKEFIDGPVETLCGMVDDWDVFQRRDFTPEVWNFIVKNRFFGMIIPKKYGGLEFTAYGHSAVISKLSSRCGPLASTVMVPNSLGPAELLLHYGTDEQKNYYLPRLADGREIPCFALTEPHAGSDAGGIRSRGVVFKDTDGSLKIRLNWNKRWITLAAISTVLGLAFKLDDPDNILGKGEHLGITCALIPTHLEGVELGRRHDPLHVPFYNCPTQGHDVVISVDDIIGGVDNAGKGWQMLMEALAAGRGISLPASANGTTKAAARIVGAHARVRKQFGLPVGMFEGVEEPLARIGGFTYMIEALRHFTCGALDSGAKPAIVTAMAKYNATELGRKVVNDSMDVLGGTGITLGPKNLVGHAYMATPISITVEGANILTRTLMIFGQGAIRCHPYVYREIEALMKHDVKAFDKNFTRHVGHVVRNAARTKLLSLTRGWIAGSPVSGPTARYYRKLSWASANFALLADMALVSLGGGLKIKEKLTGRFADIFSWMFIATSVLRKYEADGRPSEDVIYVDWTIQYALNEIQQAFDGIYRHLNPPGLGWLMKGPVRLWNRINPIGSPPSDKLGHMVAKSLIVPSKQRERLFGNIYIPKDESEPFAELESAFNISYAADELLSKIHVASKQHKLPKGKPETLVEQALEKGIISREESELIKKAEIGRDKAIQVDSFTLKEYLHDGEPYFPGREKKKTPMAIHKD